MALYRNFETIEELDKQYLPGLRVANAALATYDAIKNKNWLGAIASAAGGVAAGLSKATSVVAQARNSAFQAAALGACSSIGPATYSLTDPVSPDT